MYQYLLLMGGIIGVIIFIVVREDNLIDKDKAQQFVPVTARDVDYKSRVTIFADFFVNGEKYTCQEVITVAESKNNIKVNYGDTVIVEYYRKNPSYNRIRLKLPYSNYQRK